MNPETTNAIGTVSNSKVATTVAKQLWPTMLFLVVMSIISLFGARWWSTSLDNQTSMLISYWLWFIAMLTITGFGVYVFTIDARLQLQRQQE